jgi:hypothetical protein
MSNRRKRAFWVLGTACLLVVVALWSFRAGKFSQYPFVGQLGGEERAGPVVHYSFGGGPAYDAVRHFLFTSPPAEVLAAMKRDLLGQGWILLYQDDEFGVFQTQTGSGALQRAYCESIVGLGSKYTCSVTVPRVDRWVEDLVQTIRKKVGWEEKLEPLDVRTDPYVDWSQRNEQGRTVVTITLRNRLETDVETSIDEFYLAGYEANEVLPAVAKVPAWHKKSLTLTFPPQAGNRGRGEVILKEESTRPGDAISVGSSSTGGNAGLDPSVAIEGGKYGSHNVVLGNAEDARLLEVRNVVVTVGSTKVGGIGKWLISTKSNLRIPFSWKRLPGSPRPSIAISGEARLQPNKRWRAFLSEF